MTTYNFGTWSVDYDDANGQAVVCSNGLEVATCWHHSVGSIEKEMRANSRLIASAPELLRETEADLWAWERALELGLVPERYRENAINRIARLRTVIAKARRND